MGLFFTTISAPSLPLTLYNIGNVGSIATIAFLGAKGRKASTHATFMIHRTTHSPQFATASRLEAVTKSVLLDDERTETILKAHVNLTAEQWTEFRYHDVVLSAAEAVKGWLCLRDC